jgi:hypothetical protein
MSTALLSKVQWHPQLLSPAAASARQALAVVAPARSPRGRSVTAASMKVQRKWKWTGHNEETNLSFNMRSNGTGEFISMFACMQGGSELAPVPKHITFGLLRKREAALAAFPVAAAEWAHGFDPFPSCEQWWTLESANTDLFAVDVRGQGLHDFASLEEVAALGYTEGLQDQYIMLSPARSPRCSARWYLAVMMQVRDVQICACVVHLFASVRVTTAPTPSPVNLLR